MRPDLRRIVVAKKTLEIPLDYLVTTHVIMNSSYEKMKEIMGKEAALTFFALAADSSAWEGLEDPTSVEEMMKRLSDYGYSLHESKDKDLLKFRLHCPHASKVHPKMGAGATFCPMSQVVLGTVRKQHHRSVVLDSTLKDDGSYFEVKLQD